MATDAVFISGCYLRADEHRATCPECAARWAAETGGTLRNDQAVVTRWAEAAQPAPVWKQGRKGRKRGQPEPENEVPAARRGAASRRPLGLVAFNGIAAGCGNSVQRLLMGVTSWGCIRHAYSGCIRSRVHENLRRLALTADYVTCCKGLKRSRFIWEARSPFT